MAFEVVSLGESIWHLQSGANAGLIAADGQAIVIDCGLDDDFGRRIKRTLEANGLSLAALILTHGHADHFGGAAYLCRNFPPFPVYAPQSEAAFIEHPSLEGLMLSAGAAAFDQLKGKFTLAQACKVNHYLSAGAQSIAGIALEILPIEGHSPGQVAVRHRDILFSADAFLPTATLQKYPIPFTVHIGQALAALERLATLDGITFAPGHGPQLSTAQAREVITANHAALRRLLDAVATAIAERPRTLDEIMIEVGASLGDPLGNAVSYYLARAAVQASLVYWYEAGRAQIIGGGGLKWVRST